MKRVLFVDDEPKVLNGLQRLLRGMRNEWEMLFVNDGAKALELMGQKPVDVIVTDMMMPGMDGAELLSRVSQYYPQTIRIVLSGHSQRESILRLVGPAHQYLSKPCEAQALRETVTRAFALRDLLANEKLKQVVTQIQSLPSLPALYLDIVKELRKDEPSVANLGQLISQDPGICTKMLQLVNSAFFGLPQHIANPADAITHLGIETIKNIVTSLELFAVFEHLQMRHLSLEQLWHHSWATGALAKQIADAEQLPSREHAFIAGLLHDVGKLVLATGFREQYQSVLDQAHTASPRPMPLHVIETEALGSSHAEIGAYLLGLWGLPPAVIEAIALHHRPSACAHQNLNLVSAIHIADTLNHELSDQKPGLARATLDLDYLGSLGVRDRISSWRALAGGTPLKEAA